MNLTENERRQLLLAGFADVRQMTNARLIVTSRDKDGGAKMKTLEFIPNPLVGKAFKLEDTHMAPPIHSNEPDYVGKPFKIEDINTQPAPPFVDPQFVNKSWVPTFKRDLVPDVTYKFADPKFIGGDYSVGLFKVSPDEPRPRIVRTPYTLSAGNKVFSVMLDSHTPPAGFVEAVRALMPLTAAEKVVLYANYKGDTFEYWPELISILSPVQLVSDPAALQFMADNDRKIIADINANTPAEPTGTIANDFREDTDPPAEPTRQAQKLQQMMDGEVDARLKSVGTDWRAMADAHIKSLMKIEDARFLDAVGSRAAPRDLLDRGVAQLLNDAAMKSRTTLDVCDAVNKLVLDGLRDPQKQDKIADVLEDYVYLLGKENNWLMPYEAPPEIPGNPMLARIYNLPVYEQDLLTPGSDLRQVLRTRLRSYHDHLAFMPNGRPLVLRHTDDDAVYYSDGAERPGWWHSVNKARTYDSTREAAKAYYGLPRGKHQPAVSGAECDVVPLHYLNRPLLSLFMVRVHEALRRYGSLNLTARHELLFPTDYLTPKGE